jgi:hypothetical protein
MGKVNWVELAENRNLGLRFYPFSVLRGFSMGSEVLNLCDLYGKELKTRLKHTQFSL